MKGLTVNIRNTLIYYKSKVHIKKRDMLVASRAAAECASTNNSTLEPEIMNNSDAQDKDDWKNVFHPAAISIKEGILEEITKIAGRDIMNPILQMTDSSNFKLVYQFHIHQLFTTITEGAERQESTNIRRQFVNIAGTIFDWREAVVTNV